MEIPQSLIRRRAGLGKVPTFRTPGDALSRGSSLVTYFFFRLFPVIARSHAYGALPNNLADPRFPIAREKPLGPALKRLPRSPLAPLSMRRPSSSCPHDEVRPRQRPALGGSPRPAAASAASAGGLERSARPDLVVPHPPSQVFEGMSGAELARLKQLGVCTSHPSVCYNKG